MCKSRSLNVKDYIVSSHFYFIITFSVNSCKNNEYRCFVILVNSYWDTLCTVFTLYWITTSKTIYLIFILFIFFCLECEVIFEIGRKRTNTHFSFVSKLSEAIIRRKMLHSTLQPFIYHRFFLQFFHHFGFYWIRIKFFI